jgi:HSP20 family protein
MVFIGRPVLKLLVQRGRLAMALPIRLSRRRQNDPWDLARRDLSDVVGRLFGGVPMWSGWNEESGVAQFGVDIREDADHLYVEADLPGFKKDDIDITLENGTLTITAEKREEPSGDGRGNDSGNTGKGEYLLRERRYERLQRSFTLPSSVDDQQVQAKLDGGCLCITLSRIESSKPRKINVT